MLESLRLFVETTEPLWQWGAVMLIGTIPFIESYFGSTLGIAAGVATPVAITAAIIGNWVSMFACVVFAHRLRGNSTESKKPLSKRRQKFKRMFEKYGVPGVSLMGQSFLPSQITSGAMVGFGAKKETVIFWQTISIILWGVAFGALAHLGLDFISSN